MNNTKFFPATILGFLFSVAQPATADPFQDAFQRGDYLTAFKIARPLAEQGHPVAQFNSV